jgi:hypothetical protein
MICALKMDNFKEESLLNLMVIMNIEWLKNYNGEICGLFRKGFLINLERKDLKVKDYGDFLMLFFYFF